VRTVRLLGHDSIGGRYKIKQFTRTSLQERL
jgi:hypothetical protein